MKCFTVVKGVLSGPVSEWVMKAEEACQMGMSYQIFGGVTYHNGGFGKQGHQMAVA